MDFPLDVLAIGEVLWDIFPDEKRLGGAPFNFAAHCRQLGAHSAMVSRVGCDALGDQAVARAQEIGVEHTLVQRDPAHPTGQVRVTLGADGQPSYEFARDVAYDFLASDAAALARAATADVICFGTLAQRHPTSRHAIDQLLEAASDALRVCDLNLRAPHYSEQVVRDSLARCNLLKLNHEELLTVQQMLRLNSQDDDQLLLRLLDAYGLEMICVTLGAQGCILRTHDERIEALGYPCQVVDTVGAGDGFAAALVVQYEGGAPLVEVADFANRVGGYIATQPGAIPDITPLKLEEFASQCAPGSPEI
ncbi:MAG: carbohydrate kinase [Anaerolineales bacterium]|nr:carbohydrate kinase [Anaerolineales bacterium]